MQSIRRRIVDAVEYPSLAKAHWQRSRKNGSNYQAANASKVANFRNLFFLAVTTNKANHIECCFSFFFRRILFQTSVTVEKEKALRQSNLLYNALNSAMQQFCDVDKIKQQLCYTRRALTAKSRKIKALSAEANIKDQEIQFKDSNLKELREDLTNKKQHLLCEKRDKQKLKSQLSAIKSQISDTFLERPMTNPVYRTAGAGFRFVNPFSSE